MKSVGMFVHQWDIQGRDLWNPLYVQGYRPASRCIAHCSNSLAVDIRRYHSLRNNYDGDEVIHIERMDTDIRHSRPTWPVLLDMLRLDIRYGYVQFLSHHRYQCQLLSTCKDLGQDDSGTLHRP